MQTYTFTVILRDQTEMTEDLTEALADVQKAGCRAAWVKIETQNLVGTAPD